MLQDLIAQRLGGRAFGTSTTVYKFEKIKRAKAAAREARPEIPLIDLGVGEPHRPADPSVAAVLAGECGRAENRCYADNGIPEFQAAAAAYLERVYGVAGLDPATEILHGVGAKPILAMLPLCFVDPGDVVLHTVPGYPVLATHARYLGATTEALPLRPANGFLPDLAAVSTASAEKAKLLYINYPNNPTGAAATEDFYRRAIAWARTHRVLIVQDAAYGALTYAPHRPLSILAVPGGREVAVEVHSLSKAFNMTGWRLAFLAGHHRAVAAYATVKDNTDSGQFRAIQLAGIRALAQPEITERTVATYERRFELLVAALRAAGLPAEKPGGTFFCYVPCPTGAADGTRFPDAESCCEYLIEKAQVSTVPWDDAGAFIRFSVTFEADGEAEERRTMDELQRRLTGLGLTFA